MSEKKKASTALAGWRITATGILIALLIGIITIAIGNRKIRQGVQMKKEAESRLQIALNYAADQALTSAQSIDESLLKGNWGEASSKLSGLSSAVTLMEQVRPDSRREEVTKIKEALELLQTAVGNRSDDWRDRLDALRSALGVLREAG
jgi:hypothetical protein